MEKQPSKPSFDELAAYADGELDADKRMSMMRRMSADPSATLQTLHQQTLREAVSRSICQHTPATPADLRARIEQLVDSTDDSPNTQSGSTDRSAVAGRIGFHRWTPAAVAAALLLAATILFFATPRSDPSTSTVLAASLVSQFENRHDDCARMREQLYSSQSFPVTAAELPSAIEQTIQVKACPSLDLSEFGYRFWKAGHCNLPGQDGVHLIYNTTGDDSGKDTALSLWIVKDTGRFDHIKPGQLHRIESASYPMIVWRHGGMVCFLIGDAAVDQVDRVDQVADYLAHASY